VKVRGPKVQFSHEFKINIAIFVSYSLLEFHGVSAPWYEFDLVTSRDGVQVPLGTVVK
jgi:hypothetical protein